MRSLAGARVGLLERTHAPGHEGAIVERLVPLLRERGAHVTRVDAERSLERLDARPPWDLVVLKSGSAAALHLAAAAEAWGIPSLNAAEATRLTRDKLAAASVLQQAGLLVPRAKLSWIGPATRAVELDGLGNAPLVVKTMRSAGGTGVHFVTAAALGALLRTLPSGPYLFMERVPARGEDLKVFVAGAWLAAIRRPFPASTLAAKRGTPVAIPADVVAATRLAGRALGLTVYGCDFVEGDAGWRLVDVNAFPGYKGAAGAAEAIVAEIERAAAALSAG